MITLTNPYPPGEQLHEDFAKVSAAQLDPKRLEAAKALMGRAGCIGDALRYYNGVDPTHEVDNAYLDTLSVTEQQREIYGRVIIGLHAAEILVASIVQPGRFDRRNSRQVRLLSKEADWYKVMSTKSRGMSSPYDTIGGSLDIIREGELSTADAITLSMSAEMLSSALTWWQIAKKNVYKSDKEGFIKDEQTRTIFDDSERAMVVSTIAVQNMVKQKTIDETLTDISPEEHLQRTALGLRAQWRTGAIATHPIFRHTSPELSMDVLAGMVDSLQKVFIEGDLLDTTIYPKNEIKGLLHELLCLLDAQMIMFANPDDYKTIQVGISAPRFDMPIIGRPVNLRGVDLAIADVYDDEGVSQLINLKSGKKGHSRAYHPRVKVVKEQNFQDIDPRRLAVKLLRYGDVIKGSFMSPDTRATVDKYALESVRQELALHKKPSISDDWPYLIPPKE